LYAESGGYIDSEVDVGCEKIPVGIEAAAPSKVDFRVTVIGFPSSSIM
jgi:hypothetical protein